MIWCVSLDYPFEIIYLMAVLMRFLLYQILLGTFWKATRVATNDDWDQGMLIRTWFLHHDHQHHCELPRLIHLLGVATSWRSRWIALWIVLIQQGGPINIYAADPDPPRHEAFAHVGL